MTRPNADIAENSDLAVPIMRSHAIHCLDAQPMESATAVPGLARSRPSEWRGLQNSWAPMRRSGRLTLDFAVEIYGQQRSEGIFHEETHTMVVSAYGALISLSAAVELGQVIILTCKNREAMRCRVVHREEVKDGKAQVGIAFVTYSPNFWGVSFPTEDYRALAA